MLWFLFLQEGSNCVCKGKSEFWHFVMSGVDLSLHNNLLLKQVGFVDIHIGLVNHHWFITFAKVLLLPFSGSKFDANKVYIIYCSLKQKQSETILWILHLWKLFSYVLLPLSFKFSLRSNKHNSWFLSLKTFLHLPYIVRSGTRLVQGGKDWWACE